MKVESLFDINRKPSTNVFPFLQCNVAMEYSSANVSTYVESPASTSSSGRLVLTPSRKSSQNDQALNWDADIDEFLAEDEPNDKTFFRFIATIADQLQSGRFVFNPNPSLISMLRDKMKDSKSYGPYAHMIVRLYDCMTKLQDVNISENVLKEKYRTVIRALWPFVLGGTLIRQNRDFLIRKGGYAPEQISHLTPGIGMYFCFPGGQPVQVSINHDETEIKLVKRDKFYPSDLSAIQDEVDTELISSTHQTIQNSMYQMVDDWIHWLHILSKRNEESNFLKRLRIVTLIWLLHIDLNKKINKQKEKLITENHGNYGSFDTWTRIYEGRRSKETEDMVIDQLRVAMLNLKTKCKGVPTWGLDFKQIAIASIALVSARTKSDYGFEFDAKLLSDAQKLYVESKTYNLNNGFARSELCASASLLDAKRSTNFRWSFAESHIVALICNALGMWSAASKHVDVKWLHSFEVTLFNAYHESLKRKALTSNSKVMLHQLAPDSYEKEDKRVRDKMKDPNSCEAHAISQILNETRFQMGAIADKPKQRNTLLNSKKRMRTYAPSVASTIGEHSPYTKQMRKEPTVRQLLDNKNKQTETGHTEMDVDGSGVAQDGDLLGRVMQQSGIPNVCPNRGTSGDDTNVAKSRERITHFKHILSDLCNHIRRMGRDELRTVAQTIWSKMSKFPLPTVYHGWSVHKVNSVDTQSSLVIPSDVLDNIFPVKVGADGNCLYRSFSVLVFGHEEFHIEIRVRCLLAMILRAKHMISPAMMGEETIDIFSDLAGYTGDSDADVRSENGRYDIIWKTLQNRSEEGKWANFWHVAAMASALNNQIRLIYPHRNIPIDCKQRHVLNRVIHSATKNNNENLNVMWTWSSLPKSHKSKPDHFVPCLYCLNRLPTDETNLQPKQITSAERPITLADSEDESSTQILQTLFQEGDAEESTLSADSIHIQDSPPSYTQNRDDQSGSDINLFLDTQDTESKYNASTLAYHMPDEDMDETQKIDVSASEDEDEKYDENVPKPLLQNKTRPYSSIDNNCPENNQQQITPMKFGTPIRGQRFETVFGTPDQRVIPTATSTPQTNSLTQLNTPKSMNPPRSPLATPLERNNSTVKRNLMNTFEPPQGDMQERESTDDMDSSDDELEESKKLQIAKYLESTTPGIESVERLKQEIDYLNESLQKEKTDKCIIESRLKTHQLQYEKWQGEVDRLKREKENDSIKAKNEMKKNISDLEKLQLQLDSIREVNRQKVEQVEELTQRAMDSQMLMDSQTSTSSDIGQLEENNNCLHNEIDEMKDVVAEKKKDILSMQQTLQQKNNSLDEMRNQLEESKQQQNALQQQLQRLNDQATSIFPQIEQLTKQLNVAAQDRDRLQHERTEEKQVLQNELHEKNRQLQTSNLQYQQLQQVSDEQSNETNKIRQELSAYQIQQNQMLHQIEQLNALKTDAEENVKSIEEDYKRQLQKNQSLQSRVTELKQGHLEELSQNSDSLDKTVLESIQQQRQSNIENQKVICQLEEDIENERCQNRRLATNNASLTAEIRVLNSDMVQQKKDSEEMQQKLQKGLSDNREQQHGILLLQQDIDMLKRQKNDNGDLSVKLQTSKTETENLKQTIQELSAENGRLTSKDNNMTKSFADEMKRRQEAEQSLRKKEKEKCDLDLIIQQSSSEQKKLQARISDLDSQVVDAKNDIANKTKERDSLYSEKQTMQREIQSLAFEKDKNEQALTQKNQDIADLQQNIQNLKARVKQHKDDIQQMISKGTSTDLEVERLLKEIQGHKDSMENQKEEISQKESQNQKLKSRVSSLKNDLQNKQDELEKTCQEKDEIHHKLNQERSTSQSALDDNATLRNTVLKLKSGKHAEIEKLESQVEQLEKTEQNLSKEKDALQKEIATMMKERKQPLTSNNIEAKDDEIAQLKLQLTNDCREQEENDRLKEKVTQLERQLGEEPQVKEQVEEAVKREMDRYRHVFESLRDMNNSRSFQDSLKKQYQPDHTQPGENIDPKLKTIKDQVKAMIYSQYLAMMGEITNGKTAIEIDKVYEQYCQRILAHIDQLVKNYNLDSDFQKHLKQKSHMVNDLKEEVMDKDAEIDRLKRVNETIDKSFKQRAAELARTSTHLVEANIHAQNLLLENAKLSEQVASQTIQHETETSLLKQTLSQKARLLQKSDDDLRDAIGNMSHKEKTIRDKNRCIEGMQSKLEDKSNQCIQMRHLMNQMKDIDSPHSISSFEPELMRMKKEIQSLKDDIFKPPKRDVLQQGKSILLCLFHLFAM